MSPHRLGLDLDGSHGAKGPSRDLLYSLNSAEEKNILIPLGAHFTAMPPAA